MAINTAMSLAALPILVERGDETSTDTASQGLSDFGATHVAFTLADAGDRNLARAAASVPTTAATALTTRTSPFVRLVA
jgi:hypothetical protein